jgi:hypothetical protein
VLATVLTDSKGNYSFTGVGGGSYEVAEVVQPNWVQTQPGYPTVYSFTTQSGGNLSALVFGDHASPALSPTAVIDNGQTGYAETGSWSTALGGFNGTNRVAKTVRSGGATATASWSFPGLASGSYEVYITYAGKSTYSSAAPFTVSDSGTTLGTVDINESILVTQSQGGLAQGSYGGVGWLDAGKFSSTDGNLEVELSNKATGNFVDADGVLLVQVHTPPPQIRTGSPPSSGKVATAIGTVPPATAAVISSTKSTSTGAPSVSLAGVTQPIAVNVVYDKNPPAQANPTSIVDQILGQSGTSQDLISSLASDVISSKKGTA